MPKTIHDVDREILKIRADRRGDGHGSYSRGECVDCEKKIKQGSEKVVNSYDICWDCYKSNADPRENRLMSLINEIEIILKR